MIYLFWYTQVVQYHVWKELDRNLHGGCGTLINEGLGSFYGHFQGRHVLLHVRLQLQAPFTRYELYLKA